MPDASDRIALPIRVHDFLLACAGRVDDDVLTDAREFLAVAELDRAVELLAGSLVAGRVPVTADEREELRDLVDAVRSTRAMVDRLTIDDLSLPPRHRFTVGLDPDPAPEEGVAEAVSRVVDALPDIRSLACVWRTTPSGSPAGPVPQRLVLVETGPDGFAPSIAYRVEQALRRSGIRAVVEVVEAGADLHMYHRDALASARQVSMRSLGNGRSPAGSRSTSRLSTSAPAPPAVAEEPSYADQPTPRTVTSTRRRAAHSENRVENRSDSRAENRSAHADKRQGAESASGRWQQRVGGADQPGPPPAPAPPPMVTPIPPPVEHSQPPLDQFPVDEVPMDHGQVEHGHAAPDHSLSSVEHSDTRADSPAVDPEQAPAPRVSQIPSMPDLPPTPTMAAEPAPGRNRQAESRRGLAPVDPPSAVPPVMPAAPPVSSANGAGPPVEAAPGEPLSVGRPRADAGSGDPDADLSQREKELLRQLHEELAKREEQTTDPAAEPFGWHVDRSAGQRSGSFPPVEYSGPPWQQNSAAAAAEQTAVNGIPPYGMPPN
ncbi:MAG TPA: hypothetical protein VHW44_06875 [Pseudonocardiaceae bacterium]|nr:hypothetical protein [Pseudonocardiaceae bacterium]